METECDTSLPSTSFGDGPGIHAAFHAHCLRSHPVIELVVGKRESAAMWASRAMTSGSSKTEHLCRMACRDRRLDGIWNGVSSLVQFVLYPFPCIVQRMRVTRSRQQAPRLRWTPHWAGWEGCWTRKTQLYRRTHASYRTSRLRRSSHQLWRSCPQQSLSAFRAPEAWRPTPARSVVHLAASFHTHQCDQTEGWDTRHDNTGVYCLAGNSVKLTQRNYRVSIHHRSVIVIPLSAKPEDLLLLIFLKHRHQWACTAAASLLPSWSRNTCIFTGRPSEGCCQLMFPVHWSRLGIRCAWRLCKPGGCSTTCSVPPALESIWNLCPR